MTIQLKDPIFIAGVHQAAGESLTLGADVEAELVNRGVAVYTSRMVTPGENLVPAMIATAAAGPVLAWAGNEYQLGPVGEFYAKLGANTTVPTGTGTPTHLQFSNVITDTLSIYDAVNHLIAIPDDIVKIDCEYAIELKNDAAATGGTIRGFTMNSSAGSAISGLSAMSCTKIGMVGGAYQRASFNVYMSDYLGDDRKIKPQFRHDAGTDLFVGDSSGGGVAQTYIKMRLYRA